jgi:nucleotide-binding universal stress UspA family protein
MPPGVALAGETVVDFSLRLKKEITGTPLWVVGYSNDVFGYVPSLRVLKEGGYEGGDSLLFRPYPGPFAPEVEELIVHGEAATEIVRVAKERAVDLIVIASHGRTGLGRMIFGSTAEAVVRHARCPVLVVKPPADEEENSEQ